MTSKGKLEQTIARVKEIAGSLLKPMIMFYFIVLAITGFVVVVWFLFWIFTAH